MNLKSFLIVSAISVSGTLTSYYQSTYQYFSLEIERLYRDSIQIRFDTLGIDKRLSEELTHIIVERIHKDERFSLINRFGKMGWKLVFIEDIKNYITPNVDNPRTYFLSSYTKPYYRYYFERRID